MGQESSDNHEFFVELIDDMSQSMDKAIHGLEYSPHASLSFIQVAMNK